MLAKAVRENSNISAKLIVVHIFKHESLIFDILFNNQFSIITYNIIHLKHNMQILSTHFRVFLNILSVWHANRKAISSNEYV